MPANLASVDLATLNLATEVVLVSALRNPVCLWGQPSAEAVADGRFAKALMISRSPRARTLFLVARPWSVAIAEQGRQTGWL